MDKFLFKRGNQAKLPQLQTGEPFLSKDEERLYIGGNNGNIPLPNKKDMDEVTTQLADIVKYNYIIVQKKKYVDLCPKDEKGFVTDWLPGINQAILDSQSDNLRPILLPFGDVPISNSIIVNTNRVHLVGFGRYATKIKPTGAFAAIVFNGSAEFGTYYHELSSFQIDGGGVATVGVDFINARECWIEDCYITNCVKGVTGLNAWSNKISNTDIVNNSDVNVELGYECNDFIFDDVRFDGAGNYGFHLIDYASGITFINPCVQNCGKDGLLFDAGRGINIQGGYFENNNTLKIADTGDINFKGSVSNCLGVSIMGMAFWDNEVQASIMLDKASSIFIGGFSAGNLSVKNTLYAIQTTTNTSDVFVVASYTNLSGNYQAFNDVGKCITRIYGNTLSNIALEYGVYVNRPTKPKIAQMYFDTSVATMGKPIWRDGENFAWINADGVNAQNRGINTPITEGATSANINLPVAEKYADYSVDITPSWNTTYWVKKEEKYSSLFVVRFGTAAPSGATIDWSIKR